MGIGNLLIDVFLTHEYRLGRTSLAVASGAALICPKGSPPEFESARLRD